MEPVDALLKEVDDAVRHDRMLALWKIYRRPVIAAAGLIVLFTLGMTQYRAYQEHIAGQRMEAFSAAQALYTQEKFTEAASSFATLADGRKKEFTDLAHLWQARALIAAGKKEDAATILTTLAEHPKAMQLLWRDIACLHLVAIDASKNACLNAADPSPLTAQRSLVRAAQLWDTNHAAEAQVILEKLANDPDAPQSVRTQAQRYLSVVAPTKKG